MAHHGGGTRRVHDDAFFPRARGTVRRALSFLLLLCILGQPARADCECGYAVSSRDGDETQRHVFTELIETNFADVADIAAETAWARQAFNMTAKAARGRYGEMFSVDDVGTRRAGGLRLVVKPAQVDGMVPGAELDTARRDVWWGSFRAGLRLPAVPGTCAAFFWYLNDTAEIDMEFLTKDFRPAARSWPVNLVLQSRRSAADGYDARRAGDLVTAQLPFDPTAGFHEYGFDLLPGRVRFFADGEPLAQMNGSAVPARAGHLVLQHWSNGNPLWSGGPPAEEAALAARYVRAYFNSSSRERQEGFARRCRGPAAGGGAACAVPSVVPQGGNASEWFLGGRGGANAAGSRAGPGGKNGGRRCGDQGLPLPAVVMLVMGAAVALAQLC